MGSLIICLMRHFCFLQVLLFLKSTKFFYSKLFLYVSNKELNSGVFLLVSSPSDRQNMSKICQLSTENLSLTSESLGLTSGKSFLEGESSLCSTVEFSVRISVQPGRICHSVFVKKSLGRKSRRPHPSAWWIFGTSGRDCIQPVIVHCQLHTNIIWQDYFLEDIIKISQLNYKKYQGKGITEKSQCTTW